MKLVIIATVQNRHDFVEHMTILNVITLYLMIIERKKFLTDCVAPDVIV